MLTKLVVPILIIMLIAVLWMTHDVKDAYKILPMKTSETMDVPPFADWREFSAQSGKFKVMLPAPPQYAKEAVNIPGTDKLRRYEMYVSEKLDGDVLMISLITYPEGIDISDGKQLLNDLVTEMKNSKPGNEIKKLKTITYQGQSTLEFNIANPNFNVEGRTFLLDRTIYLLTYVAKTAEFSMSDYDYFIKTFQLTRNAETKK